MTEQIVKIPKEQLMPGILKEVEIAAVEGFKSLGIKAEIKKIEWTADGLDVLLVVDSKPQNSET